MSSAGRIQKAANEFGIDVPEDWHEVTPEQVLELRDIGKATLDDLRIYLAARGLTLRGDQTATYWQENLSSTRIGRQISRTDTAVTAPFTILIDNQEKQPWTFQGIRADADQQNRPLVVPTKTISLGPTHGDYSVDGYQGRIHFERKSIPDAIGTFTSYGDRGDRWTRTLEFLAGIELGAVLIEGSMVEMLREVRSRGKRTAGVIRKQLYSQILAWMVDYQVPFVFVERQLAEISCLQFIKRFIRKESGKKRDPAAELDELFESLG